jgi:hypothetical protein
VRGTQFTRFARTKSTNTDAEMALLECAVLSLLALLVQKSTNTDAEMALLEHHSLP